MNVPKFFLLCFSLFFLSTVACDTNIFLTVNSGRIARLLNAALVAFVTLFILTKKCGKIG